jgi:hypothetical protein
VELGCVLLSDSLVSHQRSWAKALVMLGVLWIIPVRTFETGITLLVMTVLALSIYAGVFAEFDLYVWRRFGKQLW